MGTRHGAVEVVQRQLVRARDGVVRDPLVAGPVGTRGEEPVQDGGEDGALDVELEAAPGKQLLDHRLAAGLLPQPAEQQGAADATGGQVQPLGISLKGGEQHDLIAETGAGGEQAGQCAGGSELVGAAKGGNDVLAMHAILPTVLDDLQVGAGPGGLEAEEHGTLGRAPLRGPIRQPKKHASWLGVAPHFQCRTRSGGEKLNEIRPPKSVRSRLTVQVRSG
jgi:hypothetical protein